MSSAIDKLVKDNEKSEDKKKDDATKSAEKGEKPDPEKILEAKHKQQMTNSLMLLQEAMLQYQKGRADNLLECAQKTEQFNEQFARSEMQNMDHQCNAILQNQQEKIQMAQTNEDYAYEQRKAEYIQQMFREKQERLQKTIVDIEKRAQDRQQGKDIDDRILQLQQNSKQVNDAYTKFTEGVKRMNEKIDEDYEKLKKSGQLNKSNGKKENKKEKKNDKKTLNIDGLKNVDNGKLDAGDLKDKKEEKKKSFLGL